MPIIAEVGRKTPKIRLLIGLMFLVLLVLGVAMVIPFLITLTSSVSTAMDYQRYDILPHALWSREERFTRGIVTYFPETMRGAMDQFMHLFPAAPATWTTWQLAGKDPQAVAAFAQSYLALTKDPDRYAHAKLQAADYNEFAMKYPIDDCLCSINEQDMAPFFRDYYREHVKDAPLGQRDRLALEKLGRNWGIPFESFYTIRAYRELGTPLDQMNYLPPRDWRARDAHKLYAAYQQRRFQSWMMTLKWYQLVRSHGIATNGIPFPVTARHSEDVRKLWRQFTDDITPACETRPFPLKATWLHFLGAPAQRETLKLSAGANITIDEFNKTFGTDYPTLRETPFPVPANADPRLCRIWADFVQTQYPMRLIKVHETPHLDTKFRSFMEERFKGDIARCNAIAGTQYASWDTVTLSEQMPARNEPQANLWMEFVGKLPASAKILTCAEIRYQHYLLKKYKDLAGINKAYGWNLQQLQQAQMPFDMAYLVTFNENEKSLFFNSLGANYRFVTDYLLLRGRAVINTVILILLTLLAALTINPLAAYALSRFHMRQTPAVILFMLATMAFPAAVSMIPGYLLMRDLHMLNTYWALILPGIANGMSIFLLKGFFDSLPPELYEAATLDGAKEWQVFLRITLPLSKPILAVIALNSFMAAYNSWEWALVVCQNPKMWTMAVWIYQFDTTWGTQPWAVMASFVIASLPVFLVFILCQNIILRGIILPQMK